MKRMTIKEIAQLWFLFEKQYGHDQSVRFLSEIITIQKREKDIQTIVSIIERINYEKNRQLSVTVTSAHELTDSLRDSIIQIVKKMTQAETIGIKETVDHSLLGGFTARVLDWQIDASVKRILSRLEHI